MKIDLIGFKKEIMPSQLVLIPILRLKKFSQDALNWFCLISKKIKIKGCFKELRKLTHTSQRINL